MAKQWCKNKALHCTPPPSAVLAENAPTRGSRRKEQATWYGHRPRRRIKWSRSRRYKFTLSNLAAFQLVEEKIGNNFEYRTNYPTYMFVKLLFFYEQIMRFSFSVRFFNVTPLLDISINVWKANYEATRKSFLWRARRSWPRIFWNRLPTATVMTGILFS